MFSKIWFRSVMEANRYLRWAVKYMPKFGPNECLMRARLAYEIEQKYDTAEHARINTKHRFTGVWVPGAFAWWTTKSGDGHVAICAYRKGYVFSTDQRDHAKVKGHYDRVPLTQIHDTWGAEFKFFSLDINDVTPVKMPRIRRKYP